MDCRVKPGNDDLNLAPETGVLMRGRADDGLRKGLRRHRICRCFAPVMSFFIHTESDLDTAIAGLVKVDPRFQAVLTQAGRPPLRRRADGFAGLASIVVAQQVSTASAKAIWGRLTAALDPLDHTAVLRARSPKRASRHFASLIKGAVVWPVVFHRDVASRRPADLRTEKGALELFRERVDREWVKTRPLLEGQSAPAKMPDDVCEKLKALGYIQQGCK